MFIYSSIQSVVCISFILFKMHLAMGVPVKQAISVIYNSLRYDDNTHIVTFHLREKDWDELKSTSQMWISSTDLFQVINREPVLLGGGIVKSVQVVDPLETFALFSVQNFAVTESCENCQVLKVSLHLVMWEALWPHGLCGARLRRHRAVRVRVLARTLRLFAQFLASPRCINGYQRVG